MRWRGWLVAGLVLTVVVPGAGVGAADARGVEVHDLTVDVDPGIGGRFGGRVDVAVRFRVSNTGGAPVQPTARIQVESQIGGGTTSTPIRLPSIAAGESVDVTRTIRSVLPFGSVRVTVAIRADGRATIASASTAVIPWFLLLAVVAVGTGIAIVWRRSRTAQRAP